MIKNAAIPSCAIPVKVPHDKVVEVGGGEAPVEGGPGKEPVGLDALGLVAGLPMQVRVA